MAFTESNILPIGTPAPAFSLPDTVSGRTLSFEDIKGARGTVVMWLCNHCPYVLHVNAEIVRLVADYRPKGIGFAGISSNDAEKYPADGPDLMTAHAAATGYDFPYLYDETQAVARSYDAACTPDFYVFDENGRLFYLGRLDGSRPKNDLPTDGRDLRAALDALLAGRPPLENQLPSGGCNIKWRE